MGDKSGLNSRISPESIRDVTIAFTVVLIGILGLMGVGSYYSGSLSHAQPANECSVDADCGPCQECTDQYPDKPFVELGCSDVCAAGEECIDDDCCPSERACDDVCCDDDEECIDDECCPEYRACGDECCPEGYVCLGQV